MAVLIPLWSSYLVRVFAWRLILAKDGILNWFLEQVGLGAVNIGYSNWAMWIVFSYIWLPFMILPVWAAIERVPDSFIEASADLGARGWRTFRSVLLPLILPGIAAGSIFTFSLTLGDFITPTLVGGAGSTFIGNVVYQEVGISNNVPFAAAFATVPLVRDGHLPARRAQAGGVRGAVIGTGRTSRIALAVWAALIMLFLFIPIVMIVLYAFNPSNVQSWPLSGLSTHWFSSTWHNDEVRQALWLSVRAGLIATTIAMVLGSMAAFAVHRFRFFGREAVSLFLVLPIALPGIITGMALNSFISFNSIMFSLLTIVIGHATFCIVTVYNNVLARLRRTQSSLLEASMDLGADGWQTFRFVTLPMIATALVAGGLLAFALSFDEIVVTTFTAGAQNTLPIWIFAHIRHGQQLPQVNVVVLFVILVSVIPVTLAQRLTRDTGCASARPRPAPRCRERDGRLARRKRPPTWTRCASTPRASPRACTCRATRAARPPIRGCSRRSASAR